MEIESREIPYIYTRRCIEGRVTRVNKVTSLGRGLREVD